MGEDFSVKIGPSLSSKIEWNKEIHDSRKLSFPRKRKLSTSILGSGEPSVLDPEGRLLRRSNCYYWLFVCWGWDGLGDSLEP